MKAFKQVFATIADQLKTGDQYWTFAFDAEYADPTIRRILRDMHTKLERKGIEDHVICRKSALTAIQKTFVKNTQMELKSTTTEIPTGVIILRDRVIHLLWGDIPAAYEVLDAEVVRQYQNLFTDIWSKGNERNKN